MVVYFILRLQSAGRERWAGGGGGGEAAAGTRNPGDAPELAFPA